MGCAWRQTRGTQLSAPPRPSCQMLLTSSCPSPSPGIRRARENPGRRAREEGASLCWTLVFRVRVPWCAVSSEERSSVLLRSQAFWSRGGGGPFSGRFCRKPQPYEGPEAAQGVLPLDTPGSCQPAQCCFCQFNMLGFCPRFHLMKEF